MTFPDFDYYKKNDLVCLQDLKPLYQTCMSLCQKDCKPIKHIMFCKDECELNAKNMVSILKNNQCPFPQTFNIGNTQVKIQNYYDLKDPITLITVMLLSIPMFFVIYCH